MRKKIPKIVRNIMIEYCDEIQQTEWRRQSRCVLPALSVPPLLPYPCRISTSRSISTTTGRSNLISPTWLVGFILGTTNPLKIGFSAENQWGAFSVVNLDKMNKPEKTHLCNVYNKPRIKNKNRYHMTSLLCKINWNLLQ